MNEIELKVEIKKKDVGKILYSYLMEKGIKLWFWRGSSLLYLQRGYEDKVYHLVVMKFGRGSKYYEESTHPNMNYKFRKMGNYKLVLRIKNKD